MNEEDKIVVGVINQLIDRVESTQKTLEDRQNTFEANLFSQFVALRQDIYTSYLDLKLKYDEHSQRHLVDEQRKENDTLARAHRQFTLNLILGGLALLVIVGFIVIGFVVILSK